MKTVAISGGFDPIHKGHIRYIQEAAKLGDYLVVILNNDNWLRAKKGKVFMDQYERAEIINAIRKVGYVYFSHHEVNPSDMSVTRELDIIRPQIFANGGDRKPENTPEDTVCELHGIEMVFNVGGEKIQSSSDLLTNY